jgi:hypothetical protein
MRYTRLLLLSGRRALHIMFLLLLASVLSSCATAKERTKEVLANFQSVMFAVTEEVSPVGADEKTVEILETAGERVEEACAHLRLFEKLLATKIILTLIDKIHAFLSLRDCEDEIASVAEQYPDLVEGLDLDRAVATSPESWEQLP